MKVYNSTQRVITYKSPEGGKRIKIVPGENEISKGDFDVIKEAMKGHFEAGYISDNPSAAQKKSESAGGKRAARNGGKRAARNGGKKDVSEIFDIDELKKLRKDAETPEEREAIDAQIKAVKEAE